MRAPRLLPGVTATARAEMVRATGLDASDQQWLDAVLAIIDQRAEFLGYGKHGTDTEWYAIELNGWPIAALWAPDTARIVTLRRRAEYERTAQRAGAA